MSKHILWVDNDRIFLKPHIFRLKSEGYEVKKVNTVTEGLEEIRSGQHKYDLLILDAMMPVKEEEEEQFPARETNLGRKAGVVFYNICKGMLQEAGIPALVFTIREDPYIRQDFQQAGLPDSGFMTKSEGADTADFLAKVRELTG